MNGDATIIYGQSVLSPGRLPKNQFAEAVGAFTGVRAPTARDFDVERARSTIVPVSCDFPAFIADSQGRYPPLGSKWSITGSVYLEWALRAETILSAIATTELVMSEMPNQNLEWQDCVSTPGIIYCTKKRKDQSVSQISAERTALAFFEWEEDWPEDGRSYLDLIGIAEQGISDARNRIRAHPAYEHDLRSSGTPAAILGVFKNEEWTDDSHFDVHVLKLPYLRDQLPTMAVISGVLPKGIDSRDRLVRTIEHVCSHLLLLQQTEVGFRRLRKAHGTKSWHEELSKWIEDFVLNTSPKWNFSYGEDLQEAIIDIFGQKVQLAERWRRITADAMLLKSGQS